MRFLTPAECSQWCDRWQISLNDQRQPASEFAQPYRLRCDFPPSFTQSLCFSRCIESALQPRETCLLWITNWGIFPSNENLHLYYRLRQSYGDCRLLDESPGHLCHDYERPEVVTLIQLCMLFGWDVHLIPCAGYGRAFVCHDEWAEIGFDDPSVFEGSRREFERAKLKMSASSPA